MAQPAGQSDFQVSLANLETARADAFGGKTSDHDTLVRVALAIQYATRGTRDAFQQLHDRIERLHQKIDRIERKVGSV